MARDTLDLQTNLPLFGTVKYADVRTTQYGQKAKVVMVVAEGNQHYPAGEFDVWLFPGAEKHLAALGFVDILDKMDDKGNPKLKVKSGNRTLYVHRTEERNAENKLVKRTYVGEMNRDGTVKWSQDVMTDDGAGVEVAGEAAASAPAPVAAPVAPPKPPSAAKSAPTPPPAATPAATPPVVPPARVTEGGPGKPGGEGAAPANGGGAPGKGNKKRPSEFALLLLQCADTHGACLILAREKLVAAGCTSPDAAAVQSVAATILIAFQKEYGIPQRDMERLVKDVREFLAKPKTERAPEAKPAPAPPPPPPAPTPPAPAKAGGGEGFGDWPEALDGGDDDLPF